MAALRVMTVLAVMVGSLYAAPGYGSSFNSGYQNQDSCEYSDWTPWSPCSAACNQPGFSSRSRVILHEPEDHYGFSSNGESCDTSSLEEWRDCFGEACAADCQMSAWSDWCVCSSSCGPGTRSRERIIVSDAVSGGAACGDLQEYSACDNGPCQQDCVQGDWSVWSSCQSTNGNSCGVGTRQRTRPIFANPTFGGIPCGPDSEFDSCDLGPCAQDCVMTQWTPWTACSSPCGAGTRDRSRSILQEALYGGLPCGALSDWQACDNGPCQQDCVQSQWSQWSVCSSNNGFGNRCGPGKRDRSRTTLTTPAFGGIPCGPDSEWEECDNGPCAQDCEMTQWTAWTACSSSCGAGTRDRSRSILQQALYGGLACGALSDWQACDNGPCQQDCVQGSWSAWSVCSTINGNSCGVGNRHRSRQTFTTPAFGGIPCGPDSESDSCDLGP